MYTNIQVLPFDGPVLAGSNVLLSYRYHTSAIMSSQTGVKWVSIPDQPKPSSSQEKLPGKYLPSGGSEAKPVAAQQTANPSPKFGLTVKLYILSTGGDPGSTCEIRGKFSTSRGASVDVKQDLPVNANFSGENDGRGRVLVSHYVESMDAPPSFEQHIYEEGNVITPNRYMFDNRVSWDTASYPDYYSGKQYMYQTWPIRDTSYVGVTFYTVSLLGWWYVE